MAIIKGARNLDSARKFVDWALTVEAQKIGLDVKGVRHPDQQERAAAGDGAQSRRRQGHRLTTSRNTAPAKRASGCSRAGKRTSAPSAAMTVTRRAVLCWLAVGAAGFLLVPWYALQDSVWALGWIAQFAGKGRGAGAAAGRRSRPGLARPARCAAARGCDPALARHPPCRTRQPAARDRRRRLPLSFSRRASRSGPAGWSFEPSQACVAGAPARRSTGWGWGRPWSRPPSACCSRWGSPAAATSRATAFVAGQRRQRHRAGRPCSRSSRSRRS